MNEEIVTEKSFLQIKSIRTSSNAFIMKLKEGDIIIALDGEMVHKSYEELSKELSAIKEKKVIIQLIAKYLMEQKSLIEYYFQRVTETFLMSLKN